MAKGAKRISSTVQFSELKWFQKQDIRVGSVCDCFSLGGHSDVLLWIQLHQDISIHHFLKQELEMYKIDFPSFTLSLSLRGWEWGRVCRTCTAWL